MSEVVVSTSRYAYADTLERLAKAVADTGATLFAKLDQAAAAHAAGLSLRPTTLFVFGNPKGGTPLMDAFPLVALELPLKLLVWEENGIVSVAYIPMTIVAARYGVTGKDALLAALNHTFETLVGAVG